MFDICDRMCTFQNVRYRRTKPLLSRLGFDEHLRLTDLTKDLRRQRIIQ
jgi:hypothetical protein